jgi:hypothetical protein
MSSFVFVTLASLVRPEGVLLFMVLIFHFWFYLSRKKNFDLKIFFNEIISGKNKKPVMIFLITNFLLFLFRLFYFGYPLPNTFYAKTGLSYEYLAAGFDYIGDFFNTYLLYGTVLFVISFLFIKREGKNIFYLFLSLITVIVFYTIIVGGDVLPLFRFVLPILPLIYILFTDSILQLIKVLQKRIRNSSEYMSIVATIIISSAIIFNNYLTPKARIEKFTLYENQLVEKMSATGRWIAEKQSGEKNRLVVAATTIGAVSYYSDAKIIDMLGLTDVTIAHNPQPMKIISGSHTGWKERNYNVEYLLSQKPDYIYFSTGIKPSAYAERALFLSEDFINNYYPYFFNVITNFVETIYKRKSPSVEKNNLIHFSENPNFDSNYVNLYNELLNIKNKPELKEQAYTICKQIGKIGPLNFTGAEYQLALLYQKDGDENNLFNTMEGAAAKDEYLSLAHFYLGRHYSKEKNIPFAKSHFELVQKYNPEYLEYRTRNK